MNLFKRLTASVLVASTALLGLPMSAHAGIVSSSESLSISNVATDTSSAQSEAAAAARARIEAVLAREDVRAGMTERGLTADQAMARVNALSDDEVVSLAGKLDQAPAGGDILGIIFTVFLILLVTDILGFTKVYPFTRSAR